MKKTLLLLMILLGFSIAINAQSPSTAVTVQQLAERIDTLTVTQQASIADFQKQVKRLNDKIDKKETETYDIIRLITNNLTPIINALLICIFLIILLNRLTTARYKAQQLEHNTMIKAIELTGSVPELMFTDKSSKSNRKSYKNLALFFICITFIAVVIGVYYSYNTGSLFILTMCSLAFFALAILMFVQYIRSDENKMKEREQKQKQSHETLLKCVEMTGNVTDEVKEFLMPTVIKKEMVYLIFSIVTFTLSSIFAISGMKINLFAAGICLIVSVLLFIQYIRTGDRKNKEQQ